MLAAAGSGKDLWFVTRGLGVAALVLLTASVVLGILTSVRWRARHWPRFVTAGLHRNLTLLSIAFVVVHVATTVADGYTPIGLKDAVIPFISPYRPIWLGLGAIAFDLLLVLVATSLLRDRIGYRLWRYVHWLAYASWPVALVHALGTGSDARLGWMRAVGSACVLAAAGAVVVRAAATREGRPALRLGAVAGAVLVPLAILAWYGSGPARHGWARRAGTPQTLLAGRRAPRFQQAAAVTAVAEPTTAFRSSLRGTVSQAQTPTGLVDVVIRGALRGGAGGSVRIDLRGLPDGGGGVSMTASGVSYVPAGTRTVYEGSVTGLAGERVIALVSSPAAARLQLVFDLRIDPERRSVTGIVTGVPRGSGE